MQISPDPIQSLIDAASKGAVPYLGAVAAVGTITMALIQTAKDLFPLRRLFQRGRVLEWLAEGAVDAKTKFGGDVSAGTAERDGGGCRTVGRRLFPRRLSSRSFTGNG
jgi:hypothetical protein